VVLRAPLSLTLRCLHPEKRRTCVARNRVSHGDCFRHLLGREADDPNGDTTSLSNWIEVPPRSP